MMKNNDKETTLGLNNKLVIEDTISNSILSLSKIEIDNLITIAKKINSDPTNETETFCKQCKNLTFVLPSIIKKNLKLFFINQYKTGFLLIKKNPIFSDNNNLLLTPMNNTSKIGEKTLLAKIQAIMMNVIAEMICYEAEGYGRLFQDVVPVKQMNELQTSLSSQVELEIHTEQAFSTVRPDILSLGCIRGDKNAFTYLLSVSTILSKITREEEQLLRKPLWYIGVDISFQLNNDKVNKKLRGPIPILYGQEKDPHMVYDQDLMIGVNEEANILKQKIMDIYYNYRLKINLEAGDILFLDNNRVVHGRSSFQPKYNGFDRFLVRCFGVYHFQSTEYAREKNGRMILSKYS